MQVSRRRALRLAAAAARRAGTKVGRAVHARAADGGPRRRFDGMPPRPSAQGRCAPLAARRQALRRRLADARGPRSRAWSAGGALTSPVVREAFASAIGPPGGLLGAAGRAAVSSTASSTCASTRPEGARRRRLQDGFRPSVRPSSGGQAGATGCRPPRTRSPRGGDRKPGAAECVLVFCRRAGAAGRARGRRSRGARVRGAFARFESAMGGGGDIVGAVRAGHDYLGGVDQRFGRSTPPRVPGVPLRPEARHDQVPRLETPPRAQPSPPSPPAVGGRTAPSTSSSGTTRVGPGPQAGRACR